LGILHVRMPDEELERVEKLRERIQARMGSGVRVTQRTVILEALAKLQAHFDKLDGDRGRQR
jgi:hypothetical protein